MPTRRRFGIGTVLLGGVGAVLSGFVVTSAGAETVPFNCVILPGGDVASVMITNSLDRKASCIVTCRFSNVKMDNTPQITCSKLVPPGTEIEMCRLTAAGDQMVKVIGGSAQCTK
jgi:hypothetical protein